LPAIGTVSHLHSRDIPVLFTTIMATDTGTELRNVNVTRYVTPLREGGSLPAIVEADDGFLYVLKFRGAGQGRKALISEIIGGEIARSLGFRVPEIVYANLDEAFGRIEGDEEIQDLLKASTGLNIGLHYLSGAITFDPLVNVVNERTASEIVWLDALLLNVDRTARNTNMLMWHRELWLIDHGASLYFHHTWNNWEDPRKRFPNIKDHVLLSKASFLEHVDKDFCCILTPEKIRAVVDLVPEEYLSHDPHFDNMEQHRNAYVTFLESRIANSDFFVNEANDIRKSLI
jgi:hypothetical protein